MLDKDEEDFIVVAQRRMFMKAMKYEKPPRLEKHFQLLIVADYKYARV